MWYINFYKNPDAYDLCTQVWKIELLLETRVSSSFQALCSPRLKGNTFLKAFILRENGSPVRHITTVLGQFWGISVDMFLFFTSKPKQNQTKKYPVVQWEKLFEFIQSALSPFLSSRLYWLSPLLHRNMHVLTWSSSYPVSFLLWLYTKPKIKMIKSHTCFPVSAAYCILLPGD